MCSEWKISRSFYKNDFTTEDIPPLGDGELCDRAHCLLTDCLRKVGLSLSYDIILEQVIGGKKD